MKLWPKPGSMVHVEHTAFRRKLRYYRSLNGAFQGDLPGVTTVLRVLGLATEPLIDWATSLERRACLEAVADSWQSIRLSQAPAVAAAIVENRLGKAKAHVRAKDKAADIGTAAHQLAQHWLAQQIGLDLPAPTSTPQESQLAFLAFKDRWRESGLKPVLMEQDFYDLDLGVAGRIDIVAECPQRGPGLVDLKSSKGIYTEAHLQLGAYLSGGRGFAPLQWAELWRLPKSLDNLYRPELSGVAVEVKPLGAMWDRTLTEFEVMSAFTNATALFRVLMDPTRATQEATTS